MAWKVAVDFFDLRDNRHLYRAGEPFPRPDGPVFSERRLAELAGKDNRAGIPLITYVDEPEPVRVEPKEIPKEEARKPAEAPKKTTRKRVKKDA